MWWLLACSSGDDASRDGPASGDDDDDVVLNEDPTWHDDVRPLLRTHCSGCHAADRIAGFGFDDYDVAKILAPHIADAVVSGRMPPWSADATEDCEPPPMKGDLRLPAADVQRIADWAEAGAPAGEPRPPEVEPAETAHLEPVDMTLALDGFEVPNVFDYNHCFAFQLDLNKARYLDGIELVGHDPASLHHVLFYLDRDGGPTEDWWCNELGELGTMPGLGSWEPGNLPVQLPAGLGLGLPPQSRIIAHFHWHPSGLDHVSDAQINLRFTDEVPDKLGMWRIRGNAPSEQRGLLPGPNDGDEVEFLVPAGVPDHTETMRFDVTSEVSLFGARGHMHLLGSRFEAWVERADGSRECLHAEPSYDFDWQRTYLYDLKARNWPRLYPGDTIEVRCTYDNTDANPNMADLYAALDIDEPIDTELGEKTTDEMCLLSLGTSFSD